MARNIFTPAGVAEAGRDLDAGRRGFVVHDAPGYGYKVRARCLDTVCVLHFRAEGAEAGEKDLLRSYLGPGSTIADIVDRLELFQAGYRLAMRQ